MKKKKNSPLSVKIQMFMHQYAGIWFLDCLWKKEYSTNTDIRPFSAVTYNTHTIVERNFSSNLVNHNRRQQQNNERWLCDGLFDCFYLNNTELYFKSNGSFITTQFQISNKSKFEIQLKNFDLDNLLLVHLSFFQNNTNNNRNWFPQEFVALEIDALRIYFKISECDIVFVCSLRVPNNLW